MTPLYGERGPAGGPTYKDPGAVNDVLRTGLADTFEDYAQQALEAGDRYAHGLWMTAAGIARGYVPRKAA